jgi:hypothetical protein
VVNYYASEDAVSLLAQSAAYLTPFVVFPKQQDIVCSIVKTLRVQKELEFPVFS